MVNLKQYLKDQKLSFGTYALVIYEGRTEPTWFANMGTSFNQVGNADDWFLESPCCLYKVADVGDDIDEFANGYMDEVVCLEEGESEKEYINNYVLPMIVNNVMYEIENFQCAPYLPELVDDIKLMTERECLEWMLEHKTNL